MYRQRALSAGGLKLQREPRRSYMNPYRELPACDHDVVFDEVGYKRLCKERIGYPQSLLVAEVRQRWPRLDGTCPKGCGYVGIAYASQLHYVAGDW